MADAEEETWQIQEDLARHLEEERAEKEVAIRMVEQYEQELKNKKAAVEEAAWEYSNRPDYKRGYVYGPWAWNGWLAGAMRAEYYRAHGLYYAGPHDYVPCD